MTIAIGDTVPGLKLRAFNGENVLEVDTAELLSQGRAVLFGVPGAFTPTCHRNHLPGFVEHYDTIRNLGVDLVAVVSVNDHFVMSEWAKASNAAGKILFLADSDAAFTRAIGMDIDMTERGLGVRSRRYSMIIENGRVTRVNVEESPGQAEVSGASNILRQLQDAPKNPELKLSS